MKDKETVRKKLHEVAVKYGVSDKELANDLEPIFDWIEQEAERRGRVEENKRCVKLIGEAIQATSWEAPQQFFDGLRCARSSIET